MAVSVWLGIYHSGFGLPLKMRNPPAYPNVVTEVAVDFLTVLLR
jgi:hypothetical protein